MIDGTVPGSPGWWFQRLLTRQMERLPRLERLHRYYIGDHDLPEGDERVRETYRRFQRRARSNYTGLVAESVLERLRPLGFRAGGSATSADDTDAWRIWQANHMDSDIGLVFRAALSMREAYVIVRPPDGTRGPYPVLSAEDPRETIAEMDPEDKRKPLAALRMWADCVRNQHRALLMLPDATHSAVAPLDGGLTTESWTWSVSQPNSVGRVPVVRFPNRMDLMGHCRAEFEDVMDIQDRVNSTLLDRLVIAKMQAYRQRWVTGAVFEDEDGNPLEPFKPGVDLVWAVADENARFGDFSQADLSPLLSAVRDDVRDMAAISRTPPHYLLGEFVNASGDAFSQSETGHVAKVSERMAHYGEAIEDVIRLAYAFLDDPRASTFDSEVIWADPQYRSLAEKADAAAKMSAAGVPWRTLMATVLGYSPPEITRMASERSADALLTAATAPQQAV